MTTDLILAIFHHLLVFGLAAILAAEIATVRAGLGGRGLRRLAVVDAHYGALAGLVVVVGVLRVIYGIKGPGFYLPNLMFWAKMAAFVGAALISIAPTLRIIGWRRRAVAEPGFVVSVAEATAVRRVLIVEACVFALIPIFAAAMARGYGLR